MEPYDWNHVAIELCHHATDKGSWTLTLHRTFCDETGPRHSTVQTHDTSYSFLAELGRRWLEDK